MSYPLINLKEHQYWLLERKAKLLQDPDVRLGASTTSRDRMCSA